MATTPGTPTSSAVATLLVKAYFGPTPAASTSSSSSGGGSNSPGSGSGSVLGTSSSSSPATQHLSVLGRSASMSTVTLRKSSLSVSGGGAGGVANVSASGGGGASVLPQGQQVSCAYFVVKSFPRVLGASRFRGPTVKPLSSAKIRKARDLNRPSKYTGNLCVPTVIYKSQKISASPTSPYSFQWPAFAIEKRLAGGVNGELFFCFYGQEVDSLPVVIGSVSLTLQKLQAKDGPHTLTMTHEIVTGSTTVTVTPSAEAPFDENLITAVTLQCSLPQVPDSMVSVRLRNNTILHDTETSSSGQFSPFKIPLPKVGLIDEAIFFMCYQQRTGASSKKMDYVGQVAASLREISFHSVDPLLRISNPVTDNQKDKVCFLKLHGVTFSTSTGVPFPSHSSGIPQQHIFTNLHSSSPGIPNVPVPSVSPPLPSSTQSPGLSAQQTIQYQQVNYQQPLRTSDPSQSCYGQQSLSGYPSTPSTSYPTNQQTYPTPATSPPLNTYTQAPMYPNNTQPNMYTNNNTQQTMYPNTGSVYPNQVGVGFNPQYPNYNNPQQSYSMYNVVQQAMYTHDLPLNYAPTPMQQFPQQTMPYNPAYPYPSAYNMPPPGYFSH
ncbi:hypothetical protein Pelo_10809 [Pelomyxa schiedti]|nr:hypothetical protein Pelo_10809 [Pelomyxa schiedti]